MAQMTFKSFRDMEDYLIEMDMINIEELTETLIAEAEAEAEAE